jgi:hypothetical protein
MCRVDDAGRDRKSSDSRRAATRMDEMTIALSPRDFVRAGRLRYQEQDSGQTLGEALAEYYAENAGRVMKPEQLAPESRELFRRHDMCHVIFGLDTTLEDETMADTRSILSCDVGWRRYLQYLSNPDAKAIFKELGYGRALLATVRTLPRIVRAIAENRRMRCKWPWTPPAEFLDVPLVELRRRYNIRVI